MSMSANPLEMEHSRLDEGRKLKLGWENCTILKTKAVL